MKRGRLGLMAICSLLICGGEGVAQTEIDLPQRHNFGVNLGAMGPTTSNVVFPNVLKSATPFRKIGANESWDQVDALGWPTATPPEGLESQVMGLNHPTGLYVLEYEGEGEFDLVPEEPNDSVRMISRKPGRVEYEIKPAGPVYLRLMKMNPSRPLRNIRLWLPGEGPQSGHWTRASLDEIRPFAFVRFMNFLGTNHSGLVKWEDRPVPEQYTYFKPGRDILRKGVPLEALVDLCNQTKTDPWFCMPHMADDDHVRRFATLVRDNLAKDRRVYVEYSNEVFNQAFSQSEYAAKRAVELQLVTEGESADIARYRYYSLRSVEIFRIWREVFGEEKDRVKGVVTFIARRDEHIPRILEIFNYRDHHKEIDMVGTAPYTGVGLGRRLPKPMDELTPDDLIDILIKEQREMIRPELERARKIADQFHKPIIGYEGGQHLSTFGGGFSEKDTARFGEIQIAANRSPRMAEFYRAHLSDWFEITGGPYCHYVLIYACVPGGCWGLKERIGQPIEDTPKMRAVMEFMRMEKLPGFRH